MASPQFEIRIDCFYSNIGTDLKFICVFISFLTFYHILFKSKRFQFRFSIYGNLFGQMMMRLCATAFDLPRFTYIFRVRARSPEFHKCNNLAAISTLNGVRCFASKSEAHMSINAFLFDLFSTVFRLSFLLNRFSRCESNEYNGDFVIFFSPFETNRTFFSSH